MIRKIYHNAADSPIQWENINDVLAFEGLQPLARQNIFHAQCGPYTLIVSLDPADPSQWCWAVWDHSGEGDPVRIRQTSGELSRDEAMMICESWYRHFLKEKGEA
jgi:hypothetical protein